MPRPQVANIKDHTAIHGWPRRTCIAAGVYAMAAGATTLVGWAASIPRLTDWWGDGISMFPNTALTAALCGGGLFLLGCRRAAAAALFGALGGLIGAATLLEHLTGADLGIDTRLFPRDFGQTAAAAPSRMGPPASLCFTVIGAMIALSMTPLRRFAWTGGLLVIAIALLSLIGYLYGASRLYALPHLTGIALQTSTVVLMLGVGLIASSHDSGPTLALTGESAASGLLRRALPFIIGVPILVGWLRIMGYRAKLFDQSFGAALRSLVEILAFAWLIWWAAGAVRRHEEGQREFAARHERLLESALDCIITIDHESRILEFNASAERTFGFARSDVIGRNLADCIIPPQHRQAHARGMARYLATGEGPIMNRRLELTATRSDGTEIPIEITVSRVAGVDPPQFTAFLRDITQRKETEAVLARNEEQLQKLVETRTAELERAQTDLRRAERLASIGTLATGLGHDLSNLLLPLRMRLEELDARNLAPREKEDVARIKEGLTYLQRLSGSLRQMAASPDSPPPAGGVDVCAWAVGIEGMLRSVLPRTVTLEIDCPPDLPHVHIHTAGLTQAVFNLVQNAGEAMANQPPQAPAAVVQLRARQDPSRDGWVVLTISDNGPGMSPQVLARCFEPYFSTKDRAVSTGLGLALVRGVMEGVGGIVECTSTLTQGTTFVLRLPPAAEEDAPSVAAIMDIQSPRVAAVAAAILRSLGVHVLPRSAAAAPSPDATGNEPDPGRAMLWISDNAPRHDVEKFAQSIACAAVIVGDGERPQDVNGRVVCTHAAPSTRELRSAFEKAINAARASISLTEKSSP